MIIWKVTLVAGKTRMVKAPLASSKDGALVFQNDDKATPTLILAAGSWLSCEASPPNALRH